jgi:hypothetical protein
MFAVALLVTGPALLVSPSSAAPGETVTVRWRNISAPTATDWIGLYQGGAAPTEFLDWIYASCSQTPDVARPAGECALQLPTTLSAGRYWLRLFAADAYIELTSTDLTVRATRDDLALAGAQQMP